MKYLILALLLMETASFGQTEWPIGKDTCGGRWSYDRYPKGAHKEHGLESETCKENAEKCGVEDKHEYHRCKHKNHGYTPWGPIEREESKMIHVWWDHHHIDKDKDMRAHCRELIEKRKIWPIMPHRKFPDWVFPDYGVSYYEKLGAKCTRRDWADKCQAWKYESKFKCYLDSKRRELIEKESEHCGIKSTTKVAKRCCYDQKYFVKRTDNVGTAKRELWVKSQDLLANIPNTTDDAASGGRVPGSEQCRSGDDLYVTGRPEAQKKFAYVKEVYLSIIPEVEKGAPEPVKQEFEALLHMLELLFQNHSGYYTDEQLDWILDQVTYIHTAYPELRKKPIIKIED